MTGSSLDGLIAVARSKAAANRHAFVGTEHLLAALLEDPSGFGATLVQGAGLEPAEVSRSLLEGLRQSPDPVPADDVPLSSFAQRAVQGASEEPELFRRLIANPKGRIAQVLRADPKALAALKAAFEPAKPGGAGAPPIERPASEGQPGRKRQAPGRREKEPRRENEPRRQPERTEGRTAERARPRPADRERPAPPEREPRDERPLRLAVRPHSERRRFRWSLLLLLAIPASIALSLMGGSPVLLFFVACVAVLPLAQLMGDATEALAVRTGATIGGLLNATFGNAAELIIAIVALRAGLVELVKASITGSILGNLLLILGLSFVAAGGRRDVVRFNRNNAGMSAAMLILAVAGLLFPAVLHAVHPSPDQLAELHLSEVVSGILIVTYLCSLLFSLWTHRSLFGGGDHSGAAPKWGPVASIVVLALATAGVVVESEILVRTVEAVTASLGWTEAFLGLIVIPLIGNAAEHATAVVVARKGQTDLAFQIALGSSTQVALLVAPLLVFIGLAFGSRMDLVFSVFEVAALGLATGVIAIITLDGETHWFEGVQLLAVYGMMAAAAFFI